MPGCAGASIANVKRLEWKMDHKNATAKAEGPIHDGERVRQALQGRAMAHADFAAGMGWETSKVSRMLRQRSWKTDDLARAGKILDSDFFRDYQSGKGGPILPGRVTATLLLPLHVEIDRAEFDKAQKHLRGFLGSIVVREGD